MDIELAKTFLEIMQSGTFARAAERLHVTQTTITARIHSLEANLNCTLFIRNRGGARLTPEGERFVRYAKEMIASWQAAQEVCCSPLTESKTTLSLGAENSLWNPIMVEWLIQLAEFEQLQLHSQVDNTDALYDAIRTLRLDAAVVHSARYYPDLNIEQVAEEKLIHVASVHTPEPNLYIDWGEEFAQQFDRCLPFNRQTAMQFSLGPMALKVMLKQGGNGYFRTRVVDQYLQQGHLKRVPNAPEFSYPIYLVSHRGHLPKEFNQVKHRLKRVLKSSNQWPV
ncbi:LysR family transcriptional regulator [Marinomonas pollencensis]|uniref:DNA-binding transcriptional LysR family regulator n=1 Tax=Marinomonas pollencensis TaxID=491954 RepID=A0A3E0DPJ0_9GAMM|nr:LysR family transcriptional regulator [Marinomonas pollencensis]REG83765.1 DNA-binding transcriptional LysR family regulator [Marinomonas pollencensis]